MNDTTTHMPLRVRTYDNAGSDLVVPMDLLDKVTSLLDANRVSYWVDEEALSVDEGPEITFITFSKKSDPVKIQELLDSIP